MTNFDQGTTLVQRMLGSGMSGVEVELIIKY